MRKTLTAVLLAMTLPTLAMAMPDDGARHGGDFGPRHGAEQGPRPFKDLDLSKDQQREIHKLMGEEMKNRRAITQRYLDKLPANEKTAMQDEFKAAQAKQQKAIRDLLKPEQQKVFDEQQKKGQERRAEFEAFKAWQADQAKKN
jgi:protein CpxP